jgi:hypothetical protein
LEQGIGQDPRGEEGEETEENIYSSWKIRIAATGVLK